MPEQALPLKGPVSLTLQPVLDVEAAAELRSELLRALETSACVNVDASAVRRLSTPCLQVLAAAAKSIAQSGEGRLRLHSMPQPLSEMAGLLGFAEALGIEGSQR